MPGPPRALDDRPRPQRLGQRQQQGSRTDAGAPCRRPPPEWPRTDEDWGRLWWIRLRGRARVLDDGDERERALSLLQDKYPQYRTEPPDGPVLAVDVTEVREWTA
jgi:hypothetical protein